MQSAYSVWIGQSVVLQLGAAGLRAPLLGSIVGESESAIRFRIGQDWDVDIPKLMILAVEEDSSAALVQRPSSAGGRWLGTSNASERCRA